MSMGEQVLISTNWHVWKINQPSIRVGKLEGDYQRAELGTVKPPNEIIERMRTGKYAYFLQGFKSVIRM